MLQFYFLSILLNVLTGFVFVATVEKSGAFSDEGESDLFTDNEGLEEDPGSSGKVKSSALGNFFQDYTFILVLGVLMLLVGFLKLLSPIQYDLPLVGDFIPAFAGITGGAALIVQWLSEKADSVIEIPQILEDILINGRKAIGYFCILSGILHFIFPSVPFL